MYLKWIKRIKNELLTWSKNGNCTKKLAEIELFTKDFLDIFLPRDWESLNKQNLFRKAQWYSLGKEQQFIMWTLLTLINVVPVLQKPIKIKNLQIRLFSFGVALCPNDFFCQEAWGFLVENDSVLFYKMQKKKDIYY